MTFTLILHTKQVIKPKILLKAAILPFVGLYLSTYMYYYIRITHFLITLNVILLGT